VFLLLSRGTGHDDHDFTAGFMILEPGGDLLQGPPPVFFMNLGNLPCNGAKTVLPEILSELFQGLDQTVRRLVENHCPGL
jgi:hypothetical protein